MGINNDGYTVHINFSKEEFLQFRELINISDRVAITDEVENSYSKYSEASYKDAGMVAWNAVTSAQREYDERHGIKETI